MNLKQLLVLLLALVALAQPAEALATVSAPTIASSFTPNTIASGGTSTLSVKITNTDPSTALTGLGFSDTLPGGVTIANPSAQNGNCGGTVTATVGGSSFSLTGGSLATSANCIVSVNVTSSTLGAGQNSTGTVTSDQGNGNSDTQTLTVVPPLSIASVFSPNIIGAGNTSVLSFTIANAGATKSLSGIGFTDTLPAGVTVDNPSGASAKCGTSAVLTATSGTGTISLSGGKLAPGATCTVSANVTSTTPGIVRNNTGIVSSVDGGNGNSDAQSLTIAAAPAVTLTSPGNNAVYTFGQKVLANYTCQDGAFGTGIQDCGGDAANGTPIDTTSNPGPNTFTVTAISNDGLVTDQTVSYTVLPDNRITVTHLRARRNGSVSFRVTVAGAGRVTALEYARLAHSSHRILLGALREATDVAGTDAITLSPGAAGTHLLARLHAANRARGHRPATHLALLIAVRFKPVGGRAKTIKVEPVTITP